jgi:putative pyoverdin transport system ATP-binding/permease protein
MSALRFVLRATGGAALALAAIALAGAACNAGLIAVVHRALDAQRAATWLAPAFVVCGLGKVLAAYVAGRLADAYSQRSITRLRRELSAQLLAVPYQQFERIGAGRAYAALTADVTTVNAALQSTATAAVNAAVLLGGAGYLLALDPRMFAALLALAFASFAVYRTMSTRARVLLRAARAEHDRLYGHFEALTSGAKELKLNAARRRAFLQGPLHDTTQSLLAHLVRGNAHYLLGQAVNGLLVLVPIFAVLFMFGGKAGGPGSVATGYVLTGLYLLGPLSALLRTIPLYAAVEIALERIREIGVQLGEPALEPSAEAGAIVSFRSVELRGVTHRYDERSPFALGPLSLRLVPGELVFVTGGNGSGKSTLAKLLTGLYEPREGEVLWDDEPVTPSNRDAYRQLWSCVFSEFYVFERLYGIAAAGLDARAAALIGELGLSDVVEVRDGTLSSVNLSRGQRKRLALLAALLEDRPLYLFDEWAADQDPEFKQVFYGKLLPDLKRRGKTVVAVTHDDRWFGAADRILRLDEGRAADDAIASNQIGRLVPP